MQKIELTAYPLSEKKLRENLSSAYFDKDSFEQNLSVCSLSSCQGMCCYDGVYLNEEEASVIQQIAENESDFFKGLGIDFPEKVIVDGAWENRIGLKTAVIEYPFSEELKDYPKHFNNTSCVFRLSDSRCSLQLLALEKGLHRWYYKPISCWLHPIRISLDEKIPRITLYNYKTDPYRLPNYDGYTSKTMCGSIKECGDKAHQVLREELEYLGTILHQNLMIDGGAYLGAHGPTRTPLCRSFTASANSDSVSVREGHRFC